jgi:hypothetical protein
VPRALASRVIASPVVWSLTRPGSAIPRGAR